MVRLTPSNAKAPPGKSKKGEALSSPRLFRGNVLVVKRSLVIGTRKTSISIESPFLEALKEIAVAKNLSLNKLVARINEKRQHAKLTSAIRLFVLEHYRRLAEEAASGGGKGKR
jgi:predicted DNA-binding ribbon-helix-helix protein